MYILVSLWFLIFSLASPKNLKMLKQKIIRFMENNRGLILTLFGLPLSFIFDMIMQVNFNAKCLNGIESPFLLCCSYATGSKELFSRLLQLMTIELSKFRRRFDCGICCLQRKRSSCAQLDPIGYLYLQNFSENLNATR